MGQSDMIRLLPKKPNLDLIQKKYQIKPNSVVHLAVQKISKG